MNALTQVKRAHARETALGTNSYGRTEATARRAKNEYEEETAVNRTFDSCKEQRVIER
jgi:hypothetical protein